MKRMSSKPGASEQFNHGAPVDPLQSQKLDTSTVSVTGMIS